MNFSKVDRLRSDETLEVVVPWLGVRLLIAPNCGVARELRAIDPRPGRVLCVCELPDLVPVGLPPEDARKRAAARIAFDDVVVGAHGPS